MLRRVVEANTCLWGGTQNPIIPIFRRRPNSWEDSWSWPGGRAYATGLLNGFEPDFVVETKQGLARNLGLPDRRIITLKDVLDPDRDPHVAYGISAADILRHAYDEELKFVRRRKLKAVWPPLQTAPTTLFEAVVLGAYPRDTKLQYVSKWYEEAFEPETISNGPSVVFDVLVSRAVTPLRAHQHGLVEWPGAGGRAQDAVLFLLDPTSNSDLIDFWNLRAWGGRYFPVPLDEVKEIAAAAIALIKRENVPLRGNPNPSMKHYTTILKAPSVPRDAFERASALLEPRPDGSLVMQDWMPRIWDAHSRSYDLDERKELIAARDDIDVVVDERHVRFELLEPEVASYPLLAGLPRWANTVSLRDFSSIETGLVLPEDGGELRPLLHTFDARGVQAHRSGIAVVTTGFSPSQYWRVPTGQDVVCDWFAARKLTFEPSAAGRTAIEVARSLGGLRGLGIIANVELLKWLNSASAGTWILQHELLGLLKRERPHAADNILRGLVRHSVLRLGILLSCPMCETEGWFALEELSDDLRRARCLRTFPFPSSHPPKKKWAYRTQGAFALSGYAKGAYATLLALRFLGPTHDAEMTWCPGGEVGPEGNKYELDFVAFWRQGFFQKGRVRMLVGECKNIRRV